MDSVLNNFDILITPTNFDLPFEIGNIKDIKKYYMRNARSPFNVTGHPCISIPCGLSTSGLPVGFQIVGHYNSDNYIAKITDEFLSKLNGRILVMKEFMKTCIEKQPQVDNNNDLIIRDDKNVLQMRNY